MIKSKLKIRSATKDIVLSILTSGIWGIWVLWSLHKDVSVIENRCDIKSKPKLEAFDVFLIVVYGMFLIIPITAASTLTFSDIFSDYISSFDKFSYAIGGFFQLIPVLALGAIWIGARHIRRRIFKIVEIENLKIDYFTIVIAIIFFAVTLFIAPYVTLYRTINMYNQLAVNFSE